MIEDEASLNFHEKSRSIRLKENSQVCEKGLHETYGYVKGNRLYSSGVHHIRIQLERSRLKTNSETNLHHQVWSPWIFIGICSANDRSATGDVRYHKLRSSCGWSTNGDFWINGEAKRFPWTSTPVENDVLKITIDCEHGTLSLFNERTKDKTKDLQVDLQDKTQFPWCFYLVFANQGYRVRILSSDSKHH